MPETAPISKQRGTQQYGAEIVLHGNSYDDAFQRATELQKEKGYTFVHAFDERRGQPVQMVTDWNDNMGHAHAIRVDRENGFFEGGADSRGDGAALGY
jgi:gamma-glutamyltranspeptidase